MENLGFILKQARQNLNKTLEEVHDRTRISIQHLKYLENNEFSFLPETYVKSFLKDYSKELGLDADDILHQYYEHSAQLDELKQESENLAGLDRTNPVANQILEWALGAGSLVLLISIILVYIQYRSHIYAKPMRHDGRSGTYRFLTSPDNKTKKELISVQVTAVDRVALLIIDETMSEHSLVPGEVFTWEADSSFNILVDNANAVRLSCMGEALADLGEEGQKALLTVTKKGVIAIKRTARKNTPPLP
ncbi:MAG: helix-turn-helix domain-containing protein [bacterium]